MTELRTVVVPQQRSRPDVEVLPLRERPRRAAAPPARPSASTPRWAGWVLGAALAVVVLLAAHLWLVSDAWRERAQVSEAQREQVATTALQLQQRLDAVQAELDASDARIEELAAEKARATDLRAAREQRSTTTAARS